MVSWGAPSLLSCADVYVWIPRRYNCGYRADISPLLLPYITLITLHMHASSLPLVVFIPGIFERTRDFRALSALPASLSSLLRTGFVAGHMPMRIATPRPDREPLKLVGDRAAAPVLPLDLFLRE